MTQILIFPLTLRSPPEGRREGSAVITPFPLVRYAGEVERVARRIGSLPTNDQRQDAMIAYVAAKWQSLSERGVAADELEKTVVAFAHAVWALINERECGVSA